jgi:peptidoglycan/LPS O-acetylase OafA/YrhL
MLVRQDQLAFLRGIAAAYVVVNHARAMFFVGGGRLIGHHPSVGNYLTVALLQLTAFGTEIVVLFFVLSGFAMAHSVSRSSSPSSFYLKRLIRIWPPYVAATLLAFGVGALIGVNVPLWHVIVYSDVATEATPQFWSLPYEVAFYAICPLALAGRRAVRWLACIAMAAAGVTLGLRGLALNPWPSFWPNLAGNELLFFAMGALAYHHFDRIPAVRPWGVSLVAAAAVMFAIGLRLWFGGPNMPGALAAAAATVLVLGNCPQRIPRWANLGSFSYSIYLYHFALLALLAWGLGKWGIDAAKIANPLAWTLAVPVVLCGCYVLYLVTEKPCNRLVATLRGRLPLQQQAQQLALPARRAA